MKTFDELTGRARERPAADPVVTSTFKVTKANDEKMQAFGWASVSITEDGRQIEDYQGDLIDPDDLETAVYEYVKLYRDGGEMHDPRNGIVATLIESMVFTPEKLQALGIPENTVPVGWWIGFQVFNEETWKKVKNGEYAMFSIEGTAERVEVDPGNE